MIPLLAKVFLGAFEVNWVAASVRYEKAERISKFTEARHLADQLGKPLVNVGCGGWAGLNSTFPMGLISSDVNVDYVDRPGVPNFVLGNVQDLRMFSDRQFGVAFCAHVLEHVDDPRKALAELRRISDYQVVIVPSVFSTSGPFTPDHKWLFPYGLENPVRNHGQLNRTAAVGGSLLAFLL